MGSPSPHYTTPPTLVHKWLCAGGRGGGTHTTPRADEGIALALPATSPTNLMRRGAASRTASVAAVPAATQPAVVHMGGNPRPLW